jgi:Transglycosylase SLT domain
VKGDAKTPIEKKLTDPRTNIRAGTRYLSDLMLMFPGKLELALAAYNAGEGAVKRYGNQIPPYKETQNYVKTIMQMYATLKPPALLAKRLAEVKAVQIAKPPTRVHMVIGGAARRGNMVPPAEATLPAQEITPPDKSTLVLQALPGVPSTGVQ